MEFSVAHIRDGRLLLVGYTSHHGGDDGPAHQLAMPDLPPPEALEDRRAVAAGARADGRPPKRT